MTAVRDVAGRRMPDVPLFDARTARELVDLQFAERTSMARAAATLAALGVVLASLGLYGVLATIVAARQRELAIRVALGASPAQIRARVVRSAVLQVTVGVIVGVFASIWVTRALRSQLVGLNGFHIGTYAAAACVLFAVSILAATVPARRAMRVSPNEALRAE